MGQLAHAAQQQRIVLGDRRRVEEIQLAHLASDGDLSVFA